MLNNTADRSLALFTILPDRPEAGAYSCAVLHSGTVIKMILLLSNTVLI